MRTGRGSADCRSVVQEVRISALNRHLGQNPMNYKRIISNSQTKIRTY